MTTDTEVSSDSRKQGIPTMRGTFEQEISDNRMVRICVALLLILVLPYLGWGFFIFPVADDFSPVSWTRGASGLAQTVSHFWFNNGGAYSAVIWRWLHWPLTRNGFYWTTPFLFFFLHVVFGYIAFALVVPKTRRPRLSLILALLWAGHYVIMMESPSENVFWVTGLLAYEPGNVLALLLSAMTFLSVNEGKCKFFWVRLILIPIAIGCHFSYALFVPGLLILETLFTPRNGKTVVLALVSFVFSGVVFLAPGNLARHEKALTIHQVGWHHMCFKSFFSTLEFLGREITSIHTWLLIGVFGMLHAAGLLPQRPSTDKRFLPIVALAVAVFAIAAIFFISEISGIDPPFLRTRNSLRYLTLIAVCFFGLQSPRTALFFERISGNPARILGVLLLVACGGMLVSPTYVRCVRDLMASGVEYKAWWNKFTRQVEAARDRGEAVVVVNGEPDTRPVTVLRRTWLSTEPSDWPNVNYARFFGVEAIIARENKNSH